eukprot:m.82803 g.82803  ORF g.82803 m.82803 type:complete len:68 (+) comp16340_c0_seq20:179-382(+)
MIPYQDATSSPCAGGAAVGTRAHHRGRAGTALNTIANVCAIGSVGRDTCSLTQACVDNTLADACVDG